MKILHAASECFGIAKTGGLADVVAALPAAQHALQHEVRICLPAYRGALDRLQDRHWLQTLWVREQRFELFAGRLHADGPWLWLLDCPALYARDGDPYRGSDGHDFSDNAWRFASFAEAVAQLGGGAAAGWRPDLVHLHDWQAALAAAWLQAQTERPRIVFTIHNLAYQGRYGRDTFDLLALPRAWWHPEGVEYYGDLSFIKAGLNYSDAITTVSPTYAREIQTPFYGHGLDGLLRARAGRLHGIVNGIDERSWDPGSDALLPVTYGLADVTAGKTANKRALQRRLGLPEDNRALLIFIGRLAEQKGADLLLAARAAITALPLQLIVLASGERQLEAAFRAWAQEEGQQVAAILGYDEGLSHQLTAAADLQLMPSRFEPCGLNQMYAQRYGTIPVVRRTGGLADTVVDADGPALAAAQASGVLFDHADSDGVVYGLRRALQLLGEPQTVMQLQRNGMTRDFSWRASAQQYLALYESLGA